MILEREAQTKKLLHLSGKKFSLAGIKRMSLASKISLVVLILVALSAICASIISPYNPCLLYTSPSPRD